MHIDFIIFNVCSDVLRFIQNYCIFGGYVAQIQRAHVTDIYMPLMIEEKSS